MLLKIGSLSLYSFKSLLKHSLLSCFWVIVAWGVLHTVFLKKTLDPSLSFVNFLFFFCSCFWVLVELLHGVFFILRFQRKHLTPSLFFVAFSFFFYTIFWILVELLHWVFFILCFWGLFYLCFWFIYSYFRVLWKTRRLTI